MRIRNSDSIGYENTQFREIFILSRPKTDWIRGAQLKDKICLYVRDYERPKKNRSSTDISHSTREKAYTFSGDILFESFCQWLS